MLLDLYNIPHMLILSGTQFVTLPVGYRACIVLIACQIFIFTICIRQNQRVRHVQIPKDTRLI